MEVEKLSNLPPAEQVHMNMVAQMLPGSSLQVPNVAAYLVSCLQTINQPSTHGGGRGPRSIEDDHAKQRRSQEGGESSSGGVPQKSSEEDGGKEEE